MENYVSLMQSFQKDNDCDLMIHGPTHADLCTRACALGIDEAGRGPVLGPMVYACAFVPLDCDELLRGMGLADSKVLTGETREKLFTQFHDGECPVTIGYIAHILTPHTISTNMLELNKINLNTLSHNAAIGLIKCALKIGIKVTEVFVDTVGPPEKYQEKLQEIFPNLSITVAKKADSTYPVVSAASIAAKVTRDRALSGWKWREQQLDEALLKDAGSGYPADPKTKEFLRDNVDKVFGFPQIVRMSWSTAADMMEKRCLKVHWEDDEDVSAACKRKRVEVEEQGNQSVLQFFKPRDKSSRHRNKYFRERHLLRVTSLP